MSSNLTEDEMRQALFGPSAPAAAPSVDQQVSVPKVPPTLTTPVKPRTATKPLSPKLRVTLHVSKVFEGDIEVFAYDANTLSTFVAEQEAKSAAKKKGFKYFDVVSTKPIG